MLAGGGATLTRAGLLHMDLRPENILVRSGARPRSSTGLIALIGDPALDLARTAEYGSPARLRSPLR